MKEWDYRGYRDLLMKYAELYGFDHRMYLVVRTEHPDYDQENGELIETITEDPALSEKNFLKAIRMLGCTKEEVLSRNEGALTRVYRKYQRYFDLRADWTKAQEQARMLTSDYMKTEEFEQEPFFKQCAMRALFSNVVCRAGEKLKGMSGEFPSLWPEYAEWRSFSFRTSFFVRFPFVRELSVEHDKILSRCEELYLKAMSGSLEPSEASEFNVLSSCLWASDAATHDALSYEFIDSNRQFFQEEGEHVFSRDVSIDYRWMTFWEAREFYNDSVFVAEYVLSHPLAKRKIRDFLNSTMNFICEYRLSTHPYYVKGYCNIAEKLLSPEELEECVPDSVLVPKNDAELGADRRVIREAERLLTSHLVGGLDTREIDAKGKQTKEDFLFQVNRMIKRIQSGRWVKYK